MIKKIFDKYAAWWALLGYIILTIILTWPVLLTVTTRMYAIYGDAIGGLWATWWTRYAIWDLHKLPFYSAWIAAPYGSNVPFLLAPVDHFLALIPNIIAGPIFAYNFMVLFSFILAGLGMFLLVRYLIQSSSRPIINLSSPLFIFLSAFLAGAIFAFSPYHFMRAAGHWDLAQIEWIPFYLLFLLRFGEKKKWFDLVYALIFFLLMLGTNTYYMFGLLFLTIIYVIYLIIKTGFLSPKKLSWLLPLTILLIFAGYFVYNTQVRPRIGSYTQPMRDFVIYSLMPHNYIIPSIYNKYFGAKALEVVHKDINWPLGDGNPTEKTAYLGFIPLILALVGFFSWRDSRRLFLLFAALFFFSISLKPYVDIGSFKHLPTGSLLIYYIAPFLRSVNRYSLFVQFIVSAFAGLGAAYLSKFFKGGFKFLYLFIILILAILILFIEYQMPPKILNTEIVPPGYIWLKKQPGDFIIMEFPTKNTAGFGWAEHAFYQIYHQKKIFNAHLGLNETKIPDDKKALWEKFYNTDAIFNPENIKDLKDLGVKYILFHPDAPFSPVQLDQKFIDKVEQLKELKLIDKFPEAPGAPFCCRWDGFGAVDIYEIQ